MSEGLEGRSRNPVALLLDTLALPNVDIGEKAPTSLHWKWNDSRSVSHLVLGVGPPGGSWNAMSKHIRSLSPARWLELPGYSISTWYREQLDRPYGDWLCSDPIPLGDVTHYYRDYVEKMKLGASMMSHTAVTAVERIAVPSCGGLNRSASDGSSESSDSTMGNPLSRSSDSILSNLDPFEYSCCEGSFRIDETLTTNFLSGDLTDCCNSIYCSPQMSAEQGKKDYCWRVHATKTDGSDEKIELYCKKLVLACGVNSSPCWLGVPGESLSFVSHTFSDICTKMMSLPASSTVLIVGAGLTAADAINFALEKQLCVIHVYHQDASNPSLIYHKLSTTKYKRYTDLFQLMKGKMTNDFYTPFSRSSIMEFKEDTTCVISDKSKAQRSVAVDAVGILIGSEADLDFLPQDILEELSFDARKPVSAKLNPISVHPYTFECTRVPNLYAVGSLTGDTLVRFIVGGALGVTQSLHTLKYM